MCVISYKAESEYVLLITGGLTPAEIVYDIFSDFKLEFCDFQVPEMNGKYFIIKKHDS